MRKYPKAFLTQLHYTKFLLIAAFTIPLFFPPIIRAAENQPHYTLIINQVRGPECCDPGNINFLNLQLQTLEKENLPATFAVRYDALKNEQYTKVLTDAQNKGFEMAGFLEITPLLASDSGVIYHGNIQKWYQPGSLYLLGYSQEERKKIIDTYMGVFEKTFKGTPETTVSWVIDTYSLQYLANNYHIKVHEITRDQWHTDKLTLYGGPVHYPYYPSPNWPLLPTASNYTSPIIVRQTISDPVDNYGDPTNSYTSQPNDFMRRTTNFSYFEYLFNQAHNQRLNDYTIAVIGLENSMENDYQQMFVRQLKYVGKWLRQIPANSVLLAKNFTLNQQPLFTVYEGSKQNDRSSRAWWINTSSYRVRLRLDKGRLFISDIRIYSQDFTDPYLVDTASSSAFWIVPFITDSSRIPDNLLSPIPDNQKSAGIELRNHITKAEKYSLEKEGNDRLILYDDKHLAVSSFFGDWFDLPGRQPISKNSVIRGPALYSPHLSDQPVNQKRSFLYVNNRYAIFNRNPIRFIFYPKDAQDNPAITSISVQTDPQIGNISINEQGDLSGGIVIDLSNPQPQKVEVKVKSGSENFKQTVFFAPKCSANLILCLRSPWYFWWYLLTLIRR